MTQDRYMEPARGDDARELEAAIEDTRRALSDDIKTLSERASPSHIKQEVRHKAEHAKDVAVEKAVEAKDMALDKTREITARASAQARQVGKTTRDFMRGNAVPLGLIGIGAGWLIANQRRERARALERPVQPEFSARVSAREYSAMPLEYTQDERADDTGSGVREALSARGHELYEKSGGALDRAQQGMARGRDRAQENLQRVRRRSRDLLDDNPLALAFGALVAGLGVGLLLPSSGREDELLRPGRERVQGGIREVRETARDVGRVAKQTGEETMQRMQEEFH